MNYAVVGGDVRFAHLTRLLEERGGRAAGFFLEKAGVEPHAASELKRFDAVIVNWPMGFPLAEDPPQAGEIMDALKPGTTLLLCGPKFPGDRRWDLQYVNLWADERLLTENAWLTAEGAAAAAMRESRISMRGARCAVIGFGRIGRALTELLVELGAETAVVSGSPEKRSEIEAAGGRAYAREEMQAAIRGKNFIFSTPPAQVLGKEALSAADADARIIDLASPPYGVDLDAAQTLNLRAWREPGLPGRYCPLSAAQAILNAIRRWEEAELHG